MGAPTTGVTFFVLFFQSFTLSCSLRSGAQRSLSAIL
jgi:hypothetical protein